MAPVQSRDPFVSYVATVSTYDEQHSEATRLFVSNATFSARRAFILLVLVALACDLTSRFQF